MRIKKQIVLKYIPTVVAILLAFVYTFVGEKLWLEKNIIDMNVSRYIVAKIMVLFYIGMVVTSIHIFRKKPDKNYISDYVRIFIILAGAAILQWPEPGGGWGNDTNEMVNRLYRLEWLNYQHYFSFFIYFVGAEFFPAVPTFGISLMQINVISIVLSYCLNSFEWHKLRVYRFVWILLFPTLMYLFSFPIRCIWVGIGMILLMTLMCQIYQCAEKYSEIDKKKLLLSIFVIVFIANIRKECFFIVPVFILFLFGTVWKLNKGKLFWGATVIAVIVGSIIFEYWQEYPINYNHTVFITPLQTLFGSDNLQYTQEDADAISKVIDTEALARHPSYVNMETIYEECEKWNWVVAPDDWSNFVKAFCRIVLHNMPTYLKGRIKTFVATWGFDKGWKSRGMMTGDANAILYRFVTYGINNDCNLIVKIYYFISWCSLIPIMILIGYLVISLYRKKWHMVGILCIPLIEAALVFIAQTGSEFMFHAPFYLAGYFCPFMMEAGRRKEIQ